MLNFVDGMIHDGDLPGLGDGKAWCTQFDPGVVGGKFNGGSCLYSLKSVI